MMILGILSVAIFWVMTRELDNLPRSRRMVVSGVVMAAYLVGCGYGMRAERARTAIEAPPPDSPPRCDIPRAGEILAAVGYPTEADIFVTKSDVAPLVGALNALRDQQNAIADCLSGRAPLARPHVPDRRAEQPADEVEP